ncbi:MAG TPA: hypothetical protein PKK26_17400, partial [Candidatus Wallbacteria bacterium]|nr:hypothetical protein [Candidatus Wallbacteria bacterium]
NGGSYQAVAMKWESYNSTAGGYSVMMPGKPEEKKEEIPAGNVKIMTNAAIIKTGAAEFVSMAMDFPGAISENNIDKILDSAKGNLIADPNDKIDSERKITLGVHQGREYKMSLGRGHNFKMQGKIFINVKGRKLIILSVQYNGDAFDEANAATFMNSLKIY